MKNFLLFLALAGVTTESFARSEVDTINDAIQRNDVKTLSELFNANPSLLNRSLNKDNTTPLLKAAQVGAKIYNFDVIDLLFTYPPTSINVNQADNNGYTPLHYMALASEKNDALKKKNAEIIQQLHDRNAITDAKTKDGETPLIFATSRGHASAAKQLVDYNANVNVMLPRITNESKVKEYTSTAQTSDFIGTSQYTRKGLSSNLPSTAGLMPLHIAAEKGYNNIVQMFIDNGAKLNATIEEDYTPLLLAAENNRAQVVGTLLDTKQVDVNQTTKRGYSALHLAAMRDNKETAQKLLDNGANLEQLTTDKGYTPLFLATLNNNVETLKVLLNFSNAKFPKGANVAVTVKGYTPLHRAAEGGFKAIAELLIGKKAQVNAITPSGYTPLHLAAKNNHLDVATLLLNNGAAINAQTVDNGYTPLHEAIMKNNKGMVELLIKAGADVNIKTKDGSTAWTLAQELQNKNIARYLETLPNINKRDSNIQSKKHSDELSTDA